MNRRQWIESVTAGALALSASGLVRAAAPAKKVLFFTKSSGFQHSVITRKGDQLGHAEKILIEIGKQNGFDVTASKDGRLFEPDQIGEWDAIVFYTTGDLTQAGTDKTPPMSKKGEDAFYAAIEGGKGFMGMHCATDTFGHHRGRGADDPYIQLIGGEFISHGAQQDAVLTAADSSFPGAGPLGPEFKIKDEWYSLVNINKDLHAILVHKTAGMQGWEYERPNFPQTWIRTQGKGRVFYTSMGHREEVWSDEQYQGLLIGGLRYITGQVEADSSPNLAKYAPEYHVVPKRPAPGAPKKAGARKKAAPAKSPID